MTEPRRLVALADGALLAASRDATYLLAAREKNVQVLPKLTLFPDSVLFADRRDARRIWVLHPTARSLYDYEIEPVSDAGLLSFARFIELEGFSGRAFVALADGSFAYLTDLGLRRFFPEGRSVRFSAPVRSDARLERGRRIDEMWWTPSEGTLERVSLVGKLRPVQRVELGASIFDLAVEADALAVVAVDRSSGPRRFRLIVLGADGTRRFEHPLTADPATTGDDWARAVTQNLHLALSPDARIVAVGGADRLDVWDAASGRRLGL